MELHRLTEMQEYDQDLFNRLYKKIYPYIRKLARGIDSRRYNVTPDIIQSYFVDKFIYVFNKYQGEFEEERLRITLIRSLSTFKNRLLRNAYTEQAEYYQSLSKLEDLFENSKELVEEDNEIMEERSEELYSYMKENLTPDAYLIFELELCPPPFIRNRLKTINSKVSAMMIIDFFEIPRTKTNSDYISHLRDEVKYYIEKAKEELPNRITNLGQSN